MSLQEHTYEELVAEIRKRQEEMDNNDDVKSSIEFYNDLVDLLNKYGFDLGDDLDGVHWIKIEGGLYKNIKLEKDEPLCSLELRVFPMSYIRNNL